MALYALSWRLHVTASSEAAASKVARRVDALLGGRLAVETIEPYRKVEGQQVVSCSLPLRATTFSDAVVEVLQLAGDVANGWQVTRPEEFPDHWSFEGWASESFRTAGIDFATWTLAPRQNA